MLRVLPSENVPTALNWIVVAGAIVASPGWIAIDDRFATFTVNCVFPLIEPEVAVMVVEPVLRPVTAPLIVMEATPTFEELHVTRFVISWVVVVVPSKNVPVAVNCLTVPSATVEFEGVTAMDCKTPLVTVKVVAPEMLPDAAVMVELPCATAVAKP